MALILSSFGIQCHFPVDGACDLGESELATSATAFFKPKRSRIKRLQWHYLPRDPA